MSKKWTLTEDNLVLEYYKVDIEKLCAKLPGRTRMAIVIHANRLGLGRRTWLKCEDEVIINYYPDYGASYCVKLLESRTIIAVQNRALKLDVRRILTKRKNKQPAGDISEIDYLAYNKPWRA